MVRREGVDVELGADGRAGGIEALAVNPVSAVVGLAVTLPDDDEVASGVHGDGHVSLVCLS